jgi:hypothetical protein
MKKYLIIIAALSTAACAPKGPHVVFACASSHTEMTMIPMTMPNGNGGTMMYMMPANQEVCDYGYNVCVKDGVQVHPEMCSKNG